MIATLSSSLMRASRERDGGLYRPLPRESKPRRSAPQPTEARDRPRHDRFVALRLDGGAEKRTTRGRYLPPGASVKAPGPRPAPSAILAPLPTGGAVRDATTSHAPTDAGSSPWPRCWRPGWASSSARAPSTGRPGRTRGSAPFSAACSTTRTGCSTFAGAVGAGDRRPRENLDASRVGVDISAGAEAQAPAHAPGAGRAARARAAVTAHAAPRAARVPEGSRRRARRAGGAGDRRAAGVRGGARSLLHRARVRDPLGVLRPGDSSRP